MFSEFLFTLYNLNGIKLMIKKLIAPLQKLLMQKRICPACARQLSKAILIGKLDERDVVVCKCSRVFVYDPKGLIFVRALDNDLTKMISVKAGNAYLGKRK